MNNLPQISQEDFCEFKQFLRAEKGLAQNTLSSYLLDLEKAQLFLSPLILRDATTQDLQRYLQHLALRGIHSSTQARHLSSLRHFFYFLRHDGRRSDNPTKHLMRPRVKPSLIRPLSEQALGELLQKAQQQATNPTGIRLWTLLELLYGTGLRISEALSLPSTVFQVLQQAHPALYIKGKGGQERLAPLTSMAIEALKCYQSIYDSFLSLSNAAASFFLFPSARAQQGHMTRQSAFLQIQQLALTMGYDKYDLSPHGLRHAFATHLLHRGGDVMTVKTLLGHRHVRSTQVYTHILPQDTHKAMMRLHPLASQEA